jgi:hypothetical protein
MVMVAPKKKPPGGGLTKWLRYGVLNDWWEAQKMKLATGLLILAICVSVSACTTAGGSSDRDDAINDYADCNIYASHKVASQPGDPLSLAVAAAAMCTSEKARYGQIVDAQEGPGRALAAMNALENSSIKANAATIVRARADMMSRPKAPSKPSSVPRISA